MKAETKITRVSVDTIDQAQMICSEHPEALVSAGFLYDVITQLRKEMK